MPEPEKPKPELAVIPAKIPKPELIEYCRRLLSWAEAGELRAVVGVAVWHTYSVSSLDCGRDGEYERTIAGQLDVVKTQVIDGIIESELAAEEGGDDDNSA